MSRLKDLYMDEIREQMMKKFGYKNIMQVPKLEQEHHAGSEAGQDRRQHGHR